MKGKTSEREKGRGAGRRVGMLHRSPSGTALSVSTGASNFKSVLNDTRPITIANLRTGLDPDQDTPISNHVTRLAAALGHPWSFDRIFSFVTKADGLYL